MIDFVRLLGRRWTRQRLGVWAGLNFCSPSLKTDKRQFCASGCVLDPLEPRVLLSADPILMAAPSHDDSPTSLITALLPGNEFDDADLADALFVADDEPAAPAETPIFADATTIDDPNAPIGTSAVPLGADFRDTSEFMLGSVLVTVVLFESDGSIDANLENWDPTRVDKVKSEITEGLNWWEDTLDLQNSLHDLDFIIDFTFADTPVATGYEPITRAQSEDSLWINDFLDEVNYNTGSSHFTDLNRWNHDQRVAYGTDWAFTVFVADSLADTNGKFSDNFFAYAYLGGPFVMMTYDNNGWGSDRMGQVFAHEIGHIFYALDEYPNSSSYNATSGYYNTQNLNASDGHPNPGSRVNSIMAEASKQNPAYSGNTSSPTSLEMIGWRDSDGNGIFDVLDVPLTLTGSGLFDTDTGTYSFSGQSSVNTLNNLSTIGTRHDITINTVDLIQYRIDDGEWINGNTYGLYDTPVNQTVQATLPGNHTIEFRTIVTQTGLSSNIISDSFLVEGTLPGSITVTPTTGLVTTEANGTDTFNIVLDTQPAADVTITIASSNTDEGTVSTASLIFTSQNWDTPQPVTVTGVDDDTDDGDIAYTILVQPAVSSDPAYDGIDPNDVAVTNTDNDTAGVTVTPTTGLITTEANGTDTFDVVLDSQPTADVTIGIASSNTDEGTVSTNLLTFTPANWDAPQPVTVTGADDDIDDGDTAYTIIVQPVVSTDTAYSGIDPDDVAATNTDNDTVGITVTPTTGLITTEANGTDTFDVVLDSQPTAGVTIGIASSNTDEGTVSTASLIFTSQNWDTPQPVTVTGVDDYTDDGDTAYTVLVQPAVSSDTAYSGIDPDDVAVTNLDDDEPAPPGLSVNLNDYAITSYGGRRNDNGVATIQDNGATLRLTGNTWKKARLDYLVTENTILEFGFRGDVEGEIHGIGFEENNTLTQGRVFQLYGTQAWGIAEFNTYTTEQGWTQYSIPVGQFYTGQMSYLVFSNDHDASPANAQSLYTDILIYEPPPPAGVTVTPISGLVTTEAGGTDTFEVVLDTQPTTDVTIAIASSNTEEGAVSTSSLTFTPGNWDTPQVVTVTGVDDDTDDGDVAYTVFVQPAVSADPAYSGIDPDDVAATNTDDDEPPPALTIDFSQSVIQSYSSQDHSGPVTIEDGGQTLRLQGNTWKKISLPYLITPDTVIEFDFSSDTQGEIHGIGFDDDDNIDRDQVFQLYGTQGWGITTYLNYTTGQGWAQYSIPVGQFYTGLMSYLVFSNDNDRPNSNGDSRFSNILIYESGGSPAPPAANALSDANAGPLVDSQPANPQPSVISSGIFARALGPYAQNRAAAKRPRVTIASMVLQTQADSSGVNPWERVTSGFQLSRYRG